MSTIDSLTEQLASTTVEESKKEVSFVGLSLTLDTEQDASPIVKAIEDCLGMTTLRLEGNTIGIPAAQAIGKALETKSDFQNALWKDMFTRRDKDEIPKALSFLSAGILTADAKLVVLDLSDNAFGPRGLVGIQKLLESPSCYTLQELHFNNNGLGIAGAKLLSESVCKCIENSRKHGTPLKLKIFVCGRNRLENPGAASVAKFLHQIGTLESIAMPQNGIYHPGIKELSAAFTKNPNLQVINLNDNSLTQKGGEFVAKCLPSLPKLQMLNLGDCILRDGGIKVLAAALEDNCPDLCEVNLGYNEISVEGAEAVLEAMEQKDQLQSIVLNGNNFGEDGCRYIRERMTEMRKFDMLGSLSEDEGDCDIDDDDDHYDEDDDVEEDEGDSHDESNQSIKELDPNKSLHKSPMTQISVSDFVSNPTTQGLLTLQESEEDFLSVLPKDPSITDYTDLFFKISYVVKPDDDSSTVAACKLVDDLLTKAYGLGSKDASDFNNELLISIGLIKGEDKKVKNGVDISGTLVVLEHAVKQPYFHSSTRDLLQFFLSRPMKYVTAAENAKHRLMQTLYQI